MRYHVPIRLRWSDLDAYNHVNNAKLFTILEEARVRAFWTSDDGESSPLAVIEGQQGESTQSVIARHEIEYLAQIPYLSQPIDVQMWIGKIGAASCEVCYEVWSPEDDGAAPSGEPSRTRYAIARTVIVLIDTATGRPRRISPAERAAWERFVEEPPQFRGSR